MRSWESFASTYIELQPETYIKIITIPIYIRVLLILSWGNATNDNYNSAILSFNNRNINLLHVSKIRLSGKENLFYKYEESSKSVSIYAKIAANSYSSVEGRILSSSSYNVSLLMERENTVGSLTSIEV